MPCCSFGDQFHRRPISSAGPHVELEKILYLVYSGNETAWTLTGPPVSPADLLSRRFRGGECYKA